MQCHAVARSASSRAAYLAILGEAVKAQNLSVKELELEGLCWFAKTNFTRKRASTFDKGFFFFGFAWFPPSASRRRALADSSNVRLGAWRGHTSSRASSSAFLRLARRGEELARRSRGLRDSDKMPSPALPDAEIKCPSSTENVYTVVLHTISVQ